MSSGSVDSLMDVFVNIQAHPEMLDAFNKTVTDTVKNTRTMLNGLQATADITAAKMTTVAGAGGRGGRGDGQKPPDTDASRRSELAAQIRAASDELQLLRQQATFAKAELQEIGQSDLAKPFNASLREASALSLELRQIRIAADADEEAFADIESRIASIQSRIGEFYQGGFIGLADTIAKARGNSQVQLAIKIDDAETKAAIDRSIAEIEDQIKLKKIDISTLKMQTSGLLSPEGKAAVAAVSDEMKSFEVAAARAKTQLDGGVISARQFSEALGFVSAAADDVKTALSSRIPLTIDTKGTIESVNLAIASAQDELRNRKIEIGVLQGQARPLSSAQDIARTGQLSEEAKKLEVAASRAKENLDGGIQSAREYEEALTMAALAAERVAIELQAIMSTGGVQAGLSDRVRDAAESLRALQQAATDTKKDFTDIGQKGVTKPFEDVIYNAKKVAGDLRQIKITPEVDVADTNAKLGAIEQKILDLSRLLSSSQVKASIDVQVNVDTEKTVAEIRKSIAELEDSIKVKKVGIELTAPRLVGSASGEDREKIYLLVKNLREAEIAAERFKKQIDGTPESFQRYEGAMNGVKEATEAYGAGLSEIEQVRGKSFNNLANNAYQLGQAFEDAAIGYQLNGITGAVRGASNNVSFLINDLSRVPLVQSKIANAFGATEKKVADILPLAAGIGAALAVTVLPLTVEWLESLSEVDLKIRDIADSIQDEFRQTDLTIDIRASESSFQRSLSGLGSVEDVLKKIVDLQQEFSDTTESASAKLRDLNNSGNLNDVFDQISRVSEEAKRLRKELENPIRREIRATGEVRDFSDEEYRSIAQLRTVTSLAQSIQLEVSGIFRAAQDGVLNEKQLRNASALFSAFSESVNEVRSRIRATDAEGLNKLEEQVKLIQDRFLDVSEQIKKASSLAGEQLNSGIRSAVSKTIELADKQALLRKQIEGSATEQSMFLLDVRDISKVYAELIDQTVEFYRQQGQDPSGIQEILRQQEIFASENRILEQQKTLAEKLKDAEEKLGQLREKNGENQARRSRQTTLEALSTGLQESVLSIESNSVKDNTDAISELTGEITGLNFEIARLNATRENLQTQFTDPAGFAVRQRGISFTQGLAPIDFMNSFAGVNAAVREAGTYAPAAGEILNGAAMTEAVRAGIEQALQKVLPTLKEGQNGIKDAIKQQDTQARAGQ